ncbi:uncharacterized protein TNCV_2020461 [Trichonephila clavipes]|nr:uncharacterized protein TNCV_2020461 [Trichonephila clavipes]
MQAIIVVVIRRVYSFEKKFFGRCQQRNSILQSTSSSAIEQPSTSANSSIIDDTMVQDSILNDVNIPKTDEVVEKNIDVAVYQSFEEIQFEDSAEPLTVQNSDTVATGNPDLCFFGISNIDDSLFAQLKDQDTLQAAAAILREEILGITKTKLPDYLTSQRLIKGECSTPPMISDFFSSILGGYTRKRRNCDSFKRHVSSLSQDIIYMTHNGNVKTSKHICLGMTLKSLTSSRKVIDIINHYGHCISYNAIEELETEATYSSVSRTGICSEAVNKNENLLTGMAFDNFDRFVDTKNGKDTLHDTVGIIYQNVDPNFEEEFIVEEEAGVTTHNKRKDDLLKQSSMSYHSVC